MQKKVLKIALTSLLISGAFLNVQGQTVSGFEDVTLPGTDTTYLETKYPNDGIYTFESGNAVFYGNVSWGAYWGNFNCSNGTDTVSTSYDSTAACIVGSGYNHSANYAIAYVPTDYTNVDPTVTIPVGAKLKNAAAGKNVAGVFYTNSVYAYRYILNPLSGYATNHFYLKLIMRGYLNGVKSTDSVIVNLADYTDNTNPVLVNTWKWANLTALGNVDSLTFDLISNDTAGGFGINTPAYFAIDNLITLDGVCPSAANIDAVSINENSATIGWVSNIADGNFSTNYQVAVDQSATTAPTGTATLVTANTYSASSLSPNTTYYAHLRAACPDGGFSDWDTVSFKTLPTTGIINADNNNLDVTLNPNPATNYINLNSALDLNASLYNLKGQLIMHINNVKTIDISGLATGTYILHVRNNKELNQSKTLRFIKQN